MSLEVVNPNAGGIDVGSKSHWVAIGQDAQDIREFGVYSQDNQELCKWLSENGIIITIADPTIITKSRRYKFFLFLAAGSQHKKEIIKQMFSGSNKDSSSDFDMAEYQTYTGIDDRKLASEVRNIGLSPLVHLRYPAGEPYMVKIMPYLGLCWAFSMVLGKTENHIPEEMIDKLKQEIKKEMPFRIKYM